MTGKENIKETVLTPRTDFPMKADLVVNERKTLARWYGPQPDGSPDLYAAIRKLGLGRELFVLHDGPPYANGDAHTGTGMNKILKDLVVRFRTMLGFDSPFIPGWDCHGLPIEHKVLEELGGQKPPEMSPLEVRKRCLGFARKYIESQREQFKRTLTLGRWDKPYLTIDPVYEGGVLDCFTELMERGLIARHKKPVHWSWAARSALAEAELEYENRVDPSIYVKFPMAGDRLEDADIASLANYVTEDPPFDRWSHLQSLATEEEREQSFALFRAWSNAPEAEREALRRAHREYNEQMYQKLVRRHMVALREAAEGRDLFIVIWTTTPWTLPANVAVAASPNAEYTLYAVHHAGNEEAWLIATELGPKVLEKAGVKEACALATYKGRWLQGLGYMHPLFGEAKAPQPIVIADYVTLEDGTGLVHTAPGHGAEDFETGCRFDLPTICPVGDDGAYYSGDRLRDELGIEAEEKEHRHWLGLLDGKNVFDANPHILRKLGETGLLVHTEDYSHSYPHCWRTHKPVIFRATEQWFVTIDEPKGDPLRARLLEQIRKTQWFPAWGEKRIAGMVENRPDWCISRQRYWGIPIPAFVEKDTGKVCAAPTVARRIADLVRRHGSDIWYDGHNWPVAKLLPDEFRPDEFKGKRLEKMNDIFDVWFESGASHRGVVKAEAELQGGAGKDDFRPADLYLEGDDQHRGWFQVSLILSTATQGVSPYRQCLTSAFVVDERGQKGSKSKGNIFAIDWGCEQVGADLLRLYFACVDTSSPIPVTLDLVREKTSNLYRTLRNTLRVMLGNLHDFDPRRDLVPREELPALERWALARLAGTIRAVTQAFERYEFHVGTRALIDFCNVTLSAFYIDVTKDRLYCDTSAGASRRAAQTTMYHLAHALIRLLAPICPHTADEAWAFLPGEDRPWSVHLSGWPTVEEDPNDAALEKRFSRFLLVKEDVDRILDRLRKDKTLKNSTAARVELSTENGELFDLLGNAFSPRDIATLLSVSEVMLTDGKQVYSENDRCGNDAPGYKQEIVRLQSVKTFSGQLSGEGFEKAPTCEGLSIRVTPSPYPRCERCWNHWESVTPRGKFGDAPLCERCNGVLEALST